MKTMMMALSLLMSLPFAQAQASPSIQIGIESPEAGIDYPTDRPLPRRLKEKNILTIDSYRIVVNASAELDDAIPGSDYPTDSRNKPLKVLVVGELRAPLYVEKAKAGVDYPTDTPRRSGLVMKVDGERVSLGGIESIVLPEAGIDYPTDSRIPNDLKGVLLVKLDTGSVLKLEATSQ